MWLPAFLSKRRRPGSNTQAAVPHDAGGRDASVKLVVITSDAAFYARLARLAGDQTWQISRMQSLDEAEELPDCGPSPVIVYDHDPHESGWPGAIRRLTAFPSRPCVLLASRVADDYLVQEVVRNRGYDVLCKLGRDEQMLRCLRMAGFWTLKGRTASFEG